MLSSGGCFLPLGAAAQAGGHLLHLALQLQQQATDEARLPGAICTWCPAPVLLMQPVWFPPDDGKQSLLTCWFGPGRTLALFTQSPG